LQGILYEEASFLQFALVTVILGGGAAWMTGKAMAETWRSPFSLTLYLLLLGAAVRFTHFALFEGHLLTLQFYLVDTFILLVFGFLGYRYARTKQMTTQYYWLYEKASPLSWRDRR
jgi:hypothetical protein